MNIQHSSRSDSWMTPDWVLDLVRKVLGTIDLDPASSYEANQRVKAVGYFDKEQNALSLDTWSPVPVSIYLNPPGGKRGNKSMSGLFWDKLLEQRELGLVEHAVFMCFSAEALQSTQINSRRPIGSFPICIPKRRIQFVDPTEYRQQPSHSNVIVYVPGNTNVVSRFYEVFEPVGSLMSPR